MTINYSVVLPFERDFDPVPSTVWMQRNWIHSITLSAVYALVIFWGQKIMKTKANLELQIPLVFWNALLAVFSIFGAVRMSPEFIYVLKNFGFQYSICNASYAQGVTGFWTEMFAMSKALELFDTVFIVLRKRPLIFLHWYHHITVLVYTWHAYKDHTAPGRWFVWMNYNVHSFMYTYYTIRALKFRLPKFIPICVTSLQILQMLIGCYIAITTYLIKLQGGECQQTYENLFFSFCIYLTYFWLFAKFFYGAYISGAKFRAEKETAKVMANGTKAKGAKEATKEKKES